jgi:hypothetical protein
MRRSETVYARLSEDVQHVLGTGVGQRGRDCLGHAYRQNPACMQGLTQARSVDAQITRDRMELALWPSLGMADGLLDLVEPEQPIPGSTRMALRDAGDKDQTGRGG